MKNNKYDDQHYLDDSPQSLLDGDDCLGLSAPPPPDNPASHRSLTEDSAGPEPLMSHSLPPPSPHTLDGDDPGPGVEVPPPLLPHPQG